MQDGKKLICVGVITSAHGIKGAVKIKSFTEDPSDIANYSPLYGIDGRLEYKIKILSQNGDLMIAAISGIATRNDAEKLGNTELYVTRDMLPEVGEEEFYHEDLIGLEARLVGSGKVLGFVSAINNHGAGDIIEIKMNNGKIELLAFTKSNIPEINIKAGYIVIAFPEAEFVEGDAAVG
jgi:16S rRNA processing protein RimM